MWNPCHTHTRKKNKKKIKCFVPLIRIPLEKPSPLGVLFRGCIVNSICSIRNFVCNLCPLINWVIISIIIVLQFFQLQYEGEQARFDTSSEIYTYSPGASQSNYLILIDPHISMGFRLVVNLTDDVNDDMCICDVRPFDMAVSFIGCQNPSFPPYVVRSLPPFNDTKCKKEFQLDYGLLTKLNIPCKYYYVNHRKRTAWTFFTLRNRNICETRHW